MIDWVEAVSFILKLVIVFLGLTGGTGLLVIAVNDLCVKHGLALARGSFWISLYLSIISLGFYLCF